MKEDMQPTLDRLVAGELSKPELRELVKWLDENPQGWRQCALTFMEEQGWKRSFRQMVAPATERTKPKPELRAGSWRHMLVALAATVMVAISCAFGVLGHRWWQQIEWNGNAITEELKPGGERMATRTGDAETNQTGPPLQLVGQVNLQQGGETRSVPVVNAKGIDEQWLRELPGPLNDSQIDLLKQRGYQIRQNRQWVKVELASGQVVMFPLDSVQYRYVGQPLY